LGWHYDVMHFSTEGAADAYAVFAALHLEFGDTGLRN
jgi:hypothetical protein